MVTRQSPDATARLDDDLQYARHKSVEEFPDRPRNHAATLPFHELFESLFNPLNEGRKGKTGPRARRGAAPKMKPQELRDDIIHQFISRWRAEVGDDFYPALRLIVPEKDRDRPMYGLKEKAIAALLVKLLRLNKQSEDAMSITNWKLPGQTTFSRAGDFAGRCADVLAKRSMRTTVGDMRIAEVNALLDDLASVSKEEDQMPIFEKFYNRMNAEEMTWLIRIILRQMKIGATEKTFFNAWHPNGDALFNISSSLRRVCWELTDPTQTAEEGQTYPVSLNSCFQPQLAHFQMSSFDKMLEKMGCTGEESEFWIEEKLDGERMQLHMMEDDEMPGGTRFAFWSRKANDYTYLYGKGFEDKESALTQHIKEAFPLVRNIILDGEMITWDPDEDAMVGFGTLKSAAIQQIRNPFDKTGIRPLFRVFDCLYLNDRDITGYQLSERRKALKSALKNVPRRIEIHEYTVSLSVDDIEPLLRKVVAESAEGLVLKNPRSRYALNSRNEQWMKVKPEYMEEFGESLDCLIIGGYYGSGHRGGTLSSFLCGLRVDRNLVDSQGASPMKFLSFFKVGGGFTAEDYKNVRHHTEGKWMPWDRKNPPREYIEHGISDLPDVWIKPTDSLVVEAKAASVGMTTSFAAGLTLRFPRFKKLRMDKDWQTALSVDEFRELKRRAEEESKDKAMKFDSSRKRPTKRLKKEIVIAGNDTRLTTPFAASQSAIFQGLNFCVLSEMLQPQKKSKGDIEQLIKAHGGHFWQSPTAQETMICLGDKNVVKVASLKKAGVTNIVKPVWILDALKQGEADGPERPRFLVPFEPRHMHHTIPDSREEIESTVDEYGDSYARDTSLDELQKTLEAMRLPETPYFSTSDFLADLEARGHSINDTSGLIFRGCVAWFAAEEEGLAGELERRVARLRFRFGGGTLVEEVSDERVTHVAITYQTTAEIRLLRGQIAGSGRKRIPRFVRWAWIEECWREKTRVDEERYAVGA